MPEVKHQLTLLWMRRGFTAVGIAQALRVHPVTINAWASGKRACPSGRKQQIARLLGVSYDAVDRACKGVQPLTDLEKLEVDVTVTFNN